MAAAALNKRNWWWWWWQWLSMDSISDMRGLASASCLAAWWCQ